MLSLLVYISITKMSFFKSLFCCGCTTKQVMMSVDVQLLDSSVRGIQVKKLVTVRQLKQQIYNRFSQELRQEMMSLYYRGTKIMDNMQLGDIKIKNGEQIRIVQQKANLVDTFPQFANPKGIDSLTEEIGTARMPCGHQIGRDSMIHLIESEIDKKKYQINCPYSKSKNERCSTVWNFSLCKKVGVLTKTEQEDYESALTRNWLNRDSKICPGCKSSVTKIHLNTNRVVCPKCKLQFCYICLIKWTSSDGKTCSSQSCIFLNNYVTNDIQARKFKLIDPKDGESKEYNTPKYRACIHCRSIIENVDKCKHMKCEICGLSFCWICLADPTKNGYPCGNHNQFCGTIAQVQKFE